MTVDPTDLQTARLHIGQIRVAWPMLDDARTARISRGSVALSGRAAASRDADLQAEREDREATIGYRALGASPAPLNLAVVDAEQIARQAITDLGWTIRSDLGPWSRHLEPWGLDIGQQLSWLTTMLEHARDDIVHQAAVDLRQVARTVALAVDYQAEDDWQPTGRRCPCCGQRAVNLWRRSTDQREWTRECTGERDGQPCRCDGDGCACARVGARAGSRHLWPA